jgi:uncharacterized membrane protein YebE (DUF533 family)
MFNKLIENSNPRKLIGKPKTQIYLGLIVWTYICYDEYKKYKKNNIKEEYKKLDNIKN